VSVIRVVHIACDGTEADAGPCDLMYRGTDATASFTRAEMRKLGWATGCPGGKDFCPEHKKQANNASQAGGAR
jgi:hypothetical protein